MKTFQFQVGIMFDSPDIFRRLGCGGVLISSKHILTSIKCVDWDSHPDYILLGDTAVGVDDAPTLTIEVTNYILHEDRSVNIAILEMAEAVQLDEYPNIKPVCLPEKFADFTDYDCRTTGWAHNGVNGYNSWLHETKVTISEYSDNKIVTRGNITSCYGDTGAPLVVSDPANNNGLTLAGVSDDTHCETYVNVSKYIDWINSVIADSTICPSPP